MHGGEMADLRPLSLMRSLRSAQEFYFEAGEEKNSLVVFVRVKRLEGRPKDFFPLALELADVMIIINQYGLSGTIKGRLELLPAAEACESFFRYRFNPKRPEQMRAIRFCGGEDSNIERIEIVTDKYQYTFANSYYRHSQNG